jgi:hypothetical protein
MKSSLVRLAIIVTFMQLACNAAFAVTWFDNNVRPDGACGTGSNAAPAQTEDNTQIFSARKEESDAPMLEGGDAFDTSGD